MTKKIMPTDIFVLTHGVFFIDTRNIISCGGGNSSTLLDQTFSLSNFFAHESRGCAFNSRRSHYRLANHQMKHEVGFPDIAMAPGK